jgi:hypothetical protein
MGLGPDEVRLKNVEKDKAESFPDVSLLCRDSLADRFHLWRLGRRLDRCHRTRSRSSCRSWKRAVNTEGGQERPASCAAFAWRSARGATEFVSR